MKLKYLEMKLRYVATAIIFDLYIIARLQDCQRLIDLMHDDVKYRIALWVL